MALSVHRAEIEKLIAERIALLTLSEDLLQRDGQLTKACGFRPISVFAAHLLRKETLSPACTLFQARQQLIAEDAA